MGYSTIMALPIFQDTILAMVIGIVVTIAVSAAVIFFLGFEESEDAGKETRRQEENGMQSIEGKSDPSL